MSIQISHDIKAINSRLQKLQLDLEVRLQEKQRAEEAYVKIKEEIRVLKQKLVQIAERSKEPIVTEHALLRYIERVCGIDLNAIKQQILTEAVLRQIDTLDSGKFPVGTGCFAMVKNRTVVTIE